jgi:hypothetical protein
VDWTGLEMLCGRIREHPHLAVRPATIDL